MFTSAWTCVVTTKHGHADVAMAHDFARGVTNLLVWILHMNLRHTIALLACGFALTTSARAADTIAITEFFNQPIGEPASRQWIELYNFGTLPASLKGYRIGSGGDASATHPLPPDHTIGPGDYAIVLCGGRNLVPIDQAKRVFEIEWLSGKGESRVLQIEQGTIVLGQGGGAITLVNPQRKIAWQVFYGGDGKPGRATFYTENRFRLLNIFAAKVSRGSIATERRGHHRRRLLGYEGNWIRETPKLTSRTPPVFRWASATSTDPRVPTVKRSPATAAPCVVITRRPAKSNAPSTLKPQLSPGRVTSRVWIYRYATINNRRNGNATLPSRRVG